MQPLALLDLGDAPAAALGGLLEEILVLLERAPAALRAVGPAPPAGEGVGGAEDEEEPVGEVVEPDGRQERDGEVGQAPDHD